ncbi:hypothetical protein LUX57_13025 [Actinomadura madurae]|nr:hypothetical protein [Actinomadura madurae]MCP9965929.1 hypothetical protein [Actinomadura madurae]
MTTTRNQRPSAAGTPAAGAPRGRRRDVQGTKRLAALLLSPTLLVLALVIGYPVLAGFRESLYARGEGLDAEGFVVEGDRFVGLDNYTAIFQGDRAGRVLERLRQHDVLHADHGRAGDGDRRRDGADHASGVPGAGDRAGEHPRPVGGPDRDLRPAVAVDLPGGRRRQRGAAPGDPVDRRRVPRQDGRRHRRGVEDLAVHRAARPRRPADDPPGRLRGGAGGRRRPVQQFWRITLPLVKPALLVAVLFRMLDVLRMFDLPAVLIGVNQRSVETLTMIAWFEASNLRYGSAAAYATVLFLYIALIAYLFVKLLGADIIGEARQHTRRERGSRPVKGTRRAA